MLRSPIIALVVTLLQEFLLSDKVQADLLETGAVMARPSKTQKKKGDSKKKETNVTERIPKKREGEELLTLNKVTKMIWMMHMTKN